MPNLRQFVQSSLGEDLGESRVVDLWRPRHDQVVLLGRSKSDVIISQIEETDKGGRDGIYLVMGNAILAVRACDTCAIQTPFELFEAGALSRNYENVLRRTWVALNDVKPLSTQLLRQPHSPHSQRPHGGQEAPKD